MVKRFADNPTLPSRALQIWQILVGKAHNRQTMTYGQLADLLGFAGAGVLGNHLGVIMFYCEKHDLPPLTVLVVNQESGLPGLGLTSTTDLHADRERVFNYPWYDLYPPTPDEFKAATPQRLIADAAADL
jgi:putative restriction endonuclease